jgi:hypothetical protein
LAWRRDDVGFELGAAAMASILSVCPILGGMGIALAATWPDVAIVPMVIALAPAALLFPIVLYAQSYLLWQALDVVVRPVQPDDFDTAFILAAAAR